MKKSQRGGRPSKFAEASRPVTVTLPESILKILAAVDPDRARAIVKVTEAAVGEPQQELVEVVKVGPGIGIILVGPSLYLKQIPWLRQVEVAPSHFLLSVPSGTAVDSIELALHDLLELLPPDETRERSLLEELQHLFRDIRLRKTVSKWEMLFIDTTEHERASSQHGLKLEKLSLSAS
jgi:hypothetical protein